MSLTLSYPIPSRKSLSFNDTFCCRTVGCNPNARRYSYFLATCAGTRTYRHAGTDLHGYAGDHLVAVYPGVVRWVNWGCALGYHQFTIVDAFGRGFFYAHTSDRPANGTKVHSGDYVAHLSASSCVSVGAHLHIGGFSKWYDHSTAFNLYPYLKQAQLR